MSSTAVDHCDLHEVAVFGAMKEVRIWIVGLGTVGQWLLRAMHAQAASVVDPVRLRS